MSWLCDTAELISGAWLSSGYAGHGVLGSAVPAEGLDGPSYLYPCLSLPADNAIEVRGLITRWPGLGTFTADEDGQFAYTGATDYAEFRLYADGVASSTDIGYGPGIGRVDLVVGSINATASGATLVASASLTAGSASAPSAPAPGASLQTAASLIAGTASGPAGATVPGVTLSAALSLVPGGAYGPTLASTPGFRSARPRPIFGASIGANGRTLRPRRPS